MLPRFFDIRPEERGVTLAAFFVQFGGLAAHTLLETARDALFLARLPAAQLPWMYLAMGAFGHSRLSERVFAGVTRTALLRAALPVLMCR